MPELLDRLARDGELRLAPEVDQLVRQVSPATLGRLLAPARATRPRRGATTTHVGTWLRHAMPLRTFTEWDDAGPGFLEVDLVAHGGSSPKDFYLCTLGAVDIATAWVELEAIYQRLNPLRLRRELDAELDRLSALAAPDLTARAIPRPPPPPRSRLYGALRRRLR